MSDAQIIGTLLAVVTALSGVIGTLFAQLRGLHRDHTKLQEAWRKDLMSFSDKHAAALVDLTASYATDLKTLYHQQMEIMAKTADTLDDALRRRK